MNTLEAYINNRVLTFPNYTLSSHDIKKVRHNKHLYLTDKILRKKMRRRALHPETRDTIERYVHQCISHEKPIHFVIPFGGYKHFWNTSAPEPDWAEVFHLSYMAQYATPLIAAHSPGVIIEYVSEGLILPLMNNYTESSIETYAKRYSQLISLYNSLTPKNLDFRFFSLSERYDSTKIIQQVTDLLPGRIKKFNKLSDEEKKRELHRSTRSIHWDGKKDLTSLPDQEKEQFIIRSRIVELAFYDVEAYDEHLGDYYIDDKIMTTLSFGTTFDNDEYEDLTLSSSRGSLVDFWIGRGVVYQDNSTSKLRETIISKEQYGQVQPRLSSAKITIPSLERISKNYKSIDICTQ